MRTLHAPLQVERLEDRFTPATFGVTWPDPQHLTLSFAPTGELATPTAQREALRAFQSWAVHANINFGLVAATAAMSTDVRLGARPMGETTLAVSVPFDLAGSASGDVYLNSRQAFGGKGGFDLYTVLLQEAGHVLGVDNSPDPGSVMFDFYRGARSGLSAGDVAALQGLYGARLPDRFEGAAGNDTFATAAVLSHGRVAEGDLTTMADVDYYRVAVPEGAKDLTVNLRASGVSLLQARVSVYDGDGRLVATGAAGEPGGDVRLRVENATAGATYLVKVERGSDDVFGVGAYRLAVGPQAESAGVTRQQTGPAEDGVQQLGVVAPAAGQLWEVNRRGSISGAGDEATYLLRTSAVAPAAMLVSVASAGRFAPAVAVYDAAGRELPAQVLLDDGVTVNLQLVGAAANTDYFIRVTGRGGTEGGYRLAVDLRDAPVVRDVLAAGPLGGRGQDARMLQVSEDELYHFALSGEAAGRVEGVTLRFTLHNAAGRVVFALTSLDGGLAAGDVWLPPGAYTVRVTAATQDGAPAAVSYRLEGGARSDSIGLEPENTLTRPVTGTPPASPAPAPAEATADSTAYYFGINLSFLLLTDPYSKPWYR